MQNGCGNINRFTVDGLQLTGYTVQDFLFFSPLSVPKSLALLAGQALNYFKKATLANRPSYYSTGANGIPGRAPSQTKLFQRMLHVSFPLDGGFPGG